MSPSRNDGSMRSLHEGTSRDPRQKIISSLPSVARQMSQTFSIEKSDGSLRGDIGPTPHVSCSVGSRPSTMKGQCDSDTENRSEPDRGRKPITSCPNLIETWSSSRIRPTTPTPLGRIVTEAACAYNEDRCPAVLGRESSSSQRARDCSKPASQSKKLAKRECRKTVAERSRERDNPTLSVHGSRYAQDTGA